MSVLGLALAVSGCGDSADPNQITYPSTTPDSGVVGSTPVTPVIDSGLNTTPVTNPVTNPNNPQPGFDAGTSSPLPDAGPSSTPGTGEAGTGTPPTTAAPCTGKPGMRKGKSTQMIMSGGTSRSFIYYAPAGLDPNKPVPLVIVPHGTNMSGAGMFDLTNYSQIAEREKFIAIFPDGEDGPGSLVPWNVGDGVCGLGSFVAAGGNDLGFMDDLLKFAQADQCIDEQHIFMSGFSMGGYFSNENGCMNPKIRAVGPHSGGTHEFSKCVNKRKPAIVFHFKGDSLIDYTCGTGAKDNWVKLNGCMPANPDIVKVKSGQCEYYKGCPADGQVALCSFDGGDGALPAGHCWSGGKDQGDNAFAACPEGEDAAELGWAFFKKYAW
jgi:polyhydroxybutyrate depolymerase